MANIMSLKSLRNKTSRNGFDLSSKRNFTAKAGELLPILCKEVLPGDKFEIDLKTFTRTQPLNTAAFARMREYYDFYFVPYELLWNKAGTVLTQMYDNPQHALSIAGNGSYALNGEMPYVTCSSIASYLNKVAVDSTDARRLNFLVITVQGVLLSFWSILAMVIFTLMLNLRLILSLVSLFSLTFR